MSEAYMKWPEKLYIQINLSHLQRHLMDGFMLSASAVSTSYFCWCWLYGDLQPFWNL